MKDRRKMIEFLLLMELMCWRLATFTETSLLAVGGWLKTLLHGRNGRSLLSGKEIYARNLFRLGQGTGGYRPIGGLYIGRVGRYNSHRNLRVGQGSEVGK